MVQHGGATTRTLETLPQRPPTPPRESENAEQRPSLFSRIFSKGLGTQTPNISPKSSAESLDTPSDRSHKKVVWSTSTDYNDPPEARCRNSPLSNQILRPLPPSSDRKPPKSILKPYNGAIPLNRTSSLNRSAPPHTYASFAIMLESIAKQLAGEDRMSKLDAYMSLSGVLKATENIPDPKALKDKIGLLAQFIQRDMTAQLAPGTPDAVLINNALILLASLLWKAESLPPDFCVFLLDHSIATFEDSSVSKDVAKHLMFIVGQQNFSSMIMTSDRAARLLKASHEIERHVRGKSIVLGRLGIYKKLLKQAKQSMISNNDWLKDLFEDMLTNVKDVRNPVIGFGFEAALQLGTQAKVSRGVMELFQAPQEKGKYADYFAGRLNGMIQAKQDVACVPQMWSVVILFLRSRPLQLEQWEFMNPWFQILQKCFNSSDPEVKRQANFAWNRLVFAIRPDEKTSPLFIKMLHQPFMGQLKRKNVGKHAKDMFQVTIGSICNLLYYTMKPGASSAQLDLYWDSYVAQLIGKLLASNDGEQSPQKGFQAMEGVNQAIEILRALLDPSLKQATISWKPDRAMISELMRTEELSLLDSKWVRKNCERVLDVLEPLLEYRFVDLGKNQNPVKDLWKGFLLSLAAAGAKEIKVSNETMASVARIFTMLRGFWQRCPQQKAGTENGDPAAFLDSFVYLVTESVNVLGILPFTEKKLSINDQNTFTVVATPSTHSGRIPKTVKSPIHYLITLLAGPTANVRCNATYKSAVRDILSPFFEARTSRSSRIEFCQDLVQCLPASNPNSNGVASETVWCALADFLAAAIGEKDDANSHATNSSGSHSQPLGISFRNIVRVLEYGLTSLVSEAFSHWESLFKIVSGYIKSEVGVGGHALCLIEPLARALQDQQDRVDTQSLVGICLALVNDACYPVDAQSLEAARRKLWGTPSTGPKSPIDPYKYLYSAINIYLGKSYDTYSRGILSSDEFISCVRDLIWRCPDSNLLNLLSMIGDGAACWIKDPEDILTPGASSSSKAIASLWEMICSKITMIPGIDSNALSKSETLLCAGLNSRHKSLVNSTIELWNTTYGMVCDLEYPSEVVKALVRLRSVADLNLPNFPDIPEDESAFNGPQFDDSDGDSEPFLYNGPIGLSSRDETFYLDSPTILNHRNSTSSRPAIELNQSASKKRMLEDPRTTGKHKIVKRDTTPRLRHDDSQIQFAAVESSPAADTTMDSQLLTDRQREVKERQQLDAAAMFPDIRSSPRPKTKHAGSKLSLSSDLPVSTAADEDQPGTPSINHATSAFDDFITSSPTPQRENAATQFGGDVVGSDSDAIDLPSSPPKGSSREASLAAADGAREQENALSNSDDFWNVTSFPSATSFLLGNHNDDPPSELKSITDEMMGSETISLIRGLPELESATTPVHMQMYHEERNQTPEEPKETFVDALSSPGTRDQYEELATDNDYVDAHSSPRKVQIADLNSQKITIANQDKIVEHPQVSRTTQNQTTRSSSLSDMDEDSMIRLSEKFDDAPSMNITPEAECKIMGTDKFGNTTGLALKLGGGDGFRPDSYVRMAQTPQKQIKSRKRHSTAPVSANKQSVSIELSRPERVTRSSEKRNNSDPTIPEVPSPSIGSAPSRTSRLKKATLASTIPETPTAAKASADHKKRRSPHPESVNNTPQSHPAKRRRIQRSESRFIVEDSQEAQDADIIMVAPHSRRSRRGRPRKQAEPDQNQSKGPAIVKDEGTARPRRRPSKGRDRPIKNEPIQLDDDTGPESSQGEVFAMEASIDLDAGSLIKVEDISYVGDSFVEIMETGIVESKTHNEEEAEPASGNHTNPEAENQLNEQPQADETHNEKCQPNPMEKELAREEDVKSAIDAEAEARIIKDLGQGEASGDHAPPQDTEVHSLLPIAGKTSNIHLQPADKVAPNTAEATQPVVPISSESSTKSSPELENLAVPQVKPSDAGPATVIKSEFTGATAVTRFQELLAGLQTATVSRAEVMKIEEMMWDLKAELYAAEKRGRSA